MKNIIILLIGLFLIHISSNAQYFNVFDIDTTDYPTMRAKFYSIDAEGKQILDHTPNDFEITENGKQSEVINVTCPDPLPRPMSVCIMVDTYKYINLARHGAERFVNFLDMPTNELGITAMNRGPQIVQEFTDIKKKARESCLTIPGAPGGTKVQEMFFASMTGGVPFIKGRDSQKKILILVSDLHCPNLTLDEQKLYQEAEENDIKIYTVLLRTTDYSGLFKRIADNTNGEVFENVNDSTNIENIFLDILYREQNDPCEIVWQSEIQCSEIVDLEINNIKTNIKNSDLYSLDKSQIAELTLDPSFINFGAVEPGTQKDTSITITAKNFDIEITDILLVNGRNLFKFNEPLPIPIKKNTSKVLNISYIPTDSLRQYSTFKLITNHCNQDLSFFGGFLNKPISQKTLKLTHPNGGEIFYAGSDTIITWEGISKSSNLLIEFSSNEGKDWKFISNKASNFKHQWNLPYIVSDSCLIKLVQSDPSIPKKSALLQWEKTLGGPGYDNARDIKQTTDGGYIVVGGSNSSSGDKNGAWGLTDYWVVKLNENVEIEWERSLGGSQTDNPNSVVETYDGGFVIAGHSNSINGNIKEPLGKYDFWIVKLDKNGNFLWQKSLGGKDDDIANSIQQTADGGLIVVGSSKSTSANISNNNSFYYVVKLSYNGKIEWEKSYGGIGDDIPYSVIQTIDGSYVIAGGSNSVYGKLSKSSWGLNYWIVKLDKNGNLIWQKTYGGTGEDEAIAIKQTFDGGYIVAGHSNSLNGDISNSKGKSDYWILRLDENGELLWEKSFGGSDFEFASSVQQSHDGNFIVAGTTMSEDGDISEYNQGIDYWLVFIDEKGKLLWEKSFGGSGSDEAKSISPTFDGGYIVAGRSSSMDEDVSNPKSGNDFWLVKLKGFEIVQSDTSDAVFSIIAPQPRLQNLNIDMGQMVVGSLKDTMVVDILCNDGEAPLHVLGVDITSGDDGDFLIPRGAGEFTLHEDECQTFMFEFIPTEVGTRTAYATIRTTIGDFQDTITITGEGILPQLKVESDLVNFDSVLVSTAKDSLVKGIITNVGTVPVNIKGIEFKGPNKTDFYLSSGASDTTFTIAPGESSEFGLTFEPSDIGRTTCILGVKHENQIAPLDIQLFGEGYEIRRELSAITRTIDFGEVLTTTTKDSLVNAVLKNTGNVKINVNNIQFIGANPNNFSFTGGTKDSTFILDINEEANFNLSFSPTEDREFNSTMLFEYEDGIEPIEVMLLGTGYSNDLYSFIKASDVEAETGDNVIVNLKLEDKNNFNNPGAPKNWIAELIYNGTILYFEGGLCNNDYDCTLTISGTLDEDSDNLIEIPGRVLLGNAQYDDIEISSFEWQNDSLVTDVELEDGSITITDICLEGGTRLINPNGQVSLNQPIPNITSSQTEISFETIEKGLTRLEIYNMMGNQVATIINGSIEPGKREMTLDLSDFPSGRYYIKLTTPTVTKTEKFQVVK